MNNIVGVYPYGEPKVIKIATTPDSNVAVLQPPAGYWYLIVDLWGFHDDGTSRTLKWSWYDGTNQAIHTVSAAIAANVHWPLFQDVTAASFYMPGVKVNTRVYPLLEMSAVSAGKGCGIEGLVYVMGE